MDTDPWVFLGGSARPIGCWVTFVDRPFVAFLDALTTLHRESGTGTLTVTDPEPVPECLAHLDPMQAPWTVDLAIECGYGTAYLNNGMAGGDPSAVAPALARHLGARAIVAGHMPRYGPGHQGTQLWIQGPDGVPPLMSERTLEAVAADGRWRWYESGTVQPWEHPDRYTARRKRDRLDRDLLVEYLAALGIAVDDPDFFGRGRAIRQSVPWPTRQETVEQFRADNNW